MSGYNAGNVDPPERVAAVRCPNAARESCFCLVKPNTFYSKLGEAPKMIERRDTSHHVKQAVSFVVSRTEKNSGKVIKIITLTINDCSDAFFPPSKTKMQVTLCNC